MRVINWNAEKLKALKKAHEKALKADKRRNETITVALPEEAEPAEFVISYAGYLIEYLEGEFARNAARQYPENKEGREP